MTRAEQFLAGRSESNASPADDKSPAERYLRDVSFDGVCRPGSSNAVAPRHSGGIALKTLAVVVFCVLILIGTYFVRMSGPSILGYVFGAAAFIISPAIWKAGRG